LTWRVTVSAAAPHINLRHVAGAARRDARKSARRAYFVERQEGVMTPVYDRYALLPGDELKGPAIIEERESTFVVGPGAQVEVDEYGSLVVQPKGARLTADTDEITEEV
jgi:N-methylhydantoinase A